MSESGRRPTGSSGVPDWYAGPSVGFDTAGYDTPGHPPPGYPPPGYPPPGWGRPGTWYGPPPPRGPERPGVVLAAAVLCFAQAGLVLVASFYVSLLGSVAGVFDEGVADRLLLVTLVQLLSVGALVAAGVLELSGRRLWLLIAVGVQAALTVYWTVTVSDLAAYGGDGTGLVLVPLFFLVAPAVALGLALTVEGTRWGALQARVRGERQTEAGHATSPGHRR